METTIGGTIVVIVSEWDLLKNLVSGFNFKKKLRRESIFGYEKCYPYFGYFISNCSRKNNKRGLPSCIYLQWINRSE